MPRSWRRFVTPNFMTRIEQLNREKQNELKLVENKAEMDKAQSLASLNLEISNLKAQLITLGKDKDLEKARSVSGLQQEIEKLKAQILVIRISNLP